MERAKINIYNRDCLEAMKEMPDNAYDLAIVDPPYGIGFGKFNRTNKDSSGNRYKSNKYKNGNWDSEIPSSEYFEQLLRISKNQIIWGGNYFPFLCKKESLNLKKIEDFKKYINESSENWIFWYKQDPVDNFADGEMAWVSFDFNSQFDFKYYGNLEGKTSASIKYHPTQKPVALYKWLLKNYAKEGDKILDTHYGSGSIGLACWDMKFDLDAFEIDADYYKAAVERLEKHKKQLQLF